MGWLDYVWLGILAVFEGPELFTLLGVAVGGIAQRAGLGQTDGDRRLTACACHVISASSTCTRMAGPVGSSTAASAAGADAGSGAGGRLDRRTRG